MKKEKKTSVAMVASTTKTSVHRVVSPGQKAAQVLGPSCCCCVIRKNEARGARGQTKVTAARQPRVTAAWQPRVTAVRQPRVTAAWQPRRADDIEHAAFICSHDPLPAHHVASCGGRCVWPTCSRISLVIYYFLGCCGLATSEAFQKNCNRRGEGCLGVGGRIVDGEDWFFFYLML